MAAELTDDGASLFGAPIARKVDPGSSLYNSIGLFPLSLPALSEDPRDIFNSNVRKTEQCHVFSAKEGKENIICNVRVVGTSDDEKASLEETVSAPVPRYLSLAPRLPTLPAHISTRHRIALTEQETNSMVLLAFKGTSSDLFRIDCKPPLVTIAGRSTLSVQRFLYQVRSIFVVRTLLGCACAGFACYGVDAAGLALGDQLERFLHVFDGSLSSFSDGFNAADSVACENSIEEPEATAHRISMVVLWERTKLHREFLCHLFCVIRPSRLKCFQLDEFGQFVSGDTLQGTEHNNSIEEYLKPQSWAAIAGWNLLHNIVDTFSLARNTSWTIHTAPIFEQNIFRNALDFCPMDHDSKESLNLDFSRMLLTGVLARQVSAPLLLELKAKLFDLDEEFYTQDGVRPDELQDSLLISIDALWGGFMTGEMSDHLSMESAEVDHGDNESNSRNGRRAARCVEFLLGALAWARGRVTLMLLEPGMDSDTSRNSGMDSFQRQSAAVAMRRVRIGSLQVRDKPTDRAATTGEDTEMARKFNRQEMIGAFRGINPQLILPLSPSDEVLMHAVRGKAQILMSEIGAEIERRMSQWHMSFATLSDYNNENAVSVRSMFAKAALPANQRAGEGNGVSNAPRDRVSLLQQKRDRQARNGQDETTPKTEVVDPNTETYLSGPLNTPHTVSKELVEAAKDHIRAKYVALMQQVEARSSAAAWANKRQETLSEARSELVGLFQQDATELARLRDLKKQNSESYQRHFDEQVGASPLPSPLPKTTPLLISVPAEDVALEDPIPSSSSFIVPSDDDLSVSSVDRKRTDDDGIVHTEAVSTEFFISMKKVSAGAESFVISTDSNEKTEVKERAEPVQPVNEEVFAVEPNTNEKPLPGVEPSVVVPSPAAATSSGPSHSLLDIAPHLIGHSAPNKSSSDEEALTVVRSLSHSLLLLGSSHGLVTHSTENLTTELKKIAQEHPGAPVEVLYEALLSCAAEPVSNLHSLHSVLMRSLGRAVLAQCRAINLASLHCLINSSVDLLGHIQAVDNLLLVSPNSDFLMSLCTLVVDQHLQNVRVLHRQGGAAVSSLSPLLRCQSNANLWNNEALQVGFTSALATATTANQWKEFGTLYCSMHTAEEANTAGDSVGAITMRWTAGLFSASALSSLAVEYNAPWPVPAIVTPQVLEKFSCITRRFLELGQLVALFRVVWGELRTKRVMTSRKKPAGRARPPQVDRQVSDSMRLVQQTVQHMFDYLSERVYVHQARFKQAMHRASTHGLDAVVNALNGYSKGLCDAALQLSPAESAWLARAHSNGLNASPGSLIAADPLVSLKADLNSMLECCRKVLSVSQSLNDANLQDGPRGDCFDGAVKMLQENTLCIQQHRKAVVEAAKALNANGSIELDLQPLIMRYGV